MKKLPVLVICGPTASGKTWLAVELAKAYGGEVISADSMQIYKGMNIGTAKPSLEEMNGVPHHLIDFLEPGRDFSVAQYVKLAAEVIDGIDKRGKLPVLCGGTGLYISSLIDGIRFAEMPENPVLRRELGGIAAEKGNECLWERLSICDPELAAKLHPNNLGRVIRGVEVFELTGKPLSLWQRESRAVPPVYDPCMLGLAFKEREKLYNRINLRVDQMISSGLLDEARGLYEGGYSKTASQAIGYKELIPYFEGKITLDEAEELIKMETRRYAKRQMTWLRRDSRINWLYRDEKTDSLLLEEAKRIINDTRILSRAGNADEQEP